MAYQIDYAAARQIAEHARESSPQEACGLIAGCHGHISRAFPLPNAAAEPESRFALPPSQQLRALKAIDDAGLAWIGVYHSHPRTRPTPSATDIAAANDDSLLQLIVSLQGEKPALKLWRLGPGSVEALDLRFAGQPALMTDDVDDSRAQKLAIAAAALLSLGLLLALSFHLLPAPPAISPLP